MEIKTPDNIFKNINTIKNNIVKSLWVDRPCYTDEMDLDEEEEEEHDENFYYTSEDPERSYPEDTFQNVLDNLGVLERFKAPPLNVHYDGDTLVYADWIDTTHVASPDCNMSPRKNPPQYIVIHYVVSSTSKKGTAYNVANGYIANAKKNKKVSSEFTIDDELIVQYCPDPTKYYCFAAGGASKYKPKSRKGKTMAGKVTCSNSISIEVCNESKDHSARHNPNDPRYYFTEKAVNNTVKLTKALMKYYNIPKSNVCRHYDCAGKTCPGIIGWNDEPGSNDESKWYNFLSRL